MHKKTFNIAATCLVVLLLAFVITRKQKTNLYYTNNIQTDDSSVDQASSTNYQEQVLQAVVDESIKSFESTSDSFKRKPTDTLSDIIAKNTFTQYIDYNTTENLDVDKITQDTEEALREHPVEKSNITAQDIHITDNSIASLKAYGNTLGMIQTSVVNSIYKVRNTKDNSPYIKNIYKTAGNIYKKIPVPESLIKEHLGIINGYLDYAHAFELLALQDTDPAKALGGVQLAKESQDLLLESFSSVKKIVLLNNITYQKNDPAYVWFIDAPTTEQIKLN